MSALWLKTHRRKKAGGCQNTTLRQKPASLMHHGIITISLGSGWFARLACQSVKFTTVLDLPCPEGKQSVIYFQDFLPDDLMPSKSRHASTMMVSPVFSAFKYSVLTKHLLVCKAFIADQRQRFNGIGRIASIVPIFFSSLACLFLMASAQAQMTAPAPVAASPHPAAAGKILLKPNVSMCIGCHGIPGYHASFPEVYQVPMISGQSAAYIENALKDYRKGARSHPSMYSVAKSLTDTEISALAAYYSQASKK